MESLLGSAHIHALASLTLFGVDDGDEVAAMLGHAAGSNTLEQLHLWDSEVTARGARSLIESRHLRALTSLSLGGNELGDEDADVLARSSMLRRLTSLDL